MNPKLFAVLVLCLPLAGPAVAADKKKKKPATSDKRSTLPPKSSMIVIPPPDASTAPAQSTKLITSEMSGSDLEFFTRVVDAGRLQAYVVDLLKSRASSEQIKMVGEALVGTQESENKQIARLAAAKGWTVSTEPTAVQKKVGADLEKLSGSNFDKAAMDQVITASQQAFVAYQTAAQSSDPEIKEFSQQMLPVAKERLQIVEKLTGAGNKAASQLFRTKAEPKTPETSPAPVTAPPKPEPAVKPATPAPATPAPKSSTHSKKGPAPAAQATPPPTPAATPAPEKKEEPAAEKKPTEATVPTTPAATPKSKVIFPVPVDPATIPLTSPRPVSVIPSEPKAIPPPITK